MLDTVVISSEYVWSSVVFGTLVGVSVFSDTWSELLMTSAIGCPRWSSVYECQRVECAFTSPVRNESSGFYLVSFSLIKMCSQGVNSHNLSSSCFNMSRVHYIIYIKTHTVKCMLDLLHFLAYSIFNMFKKIVFSINRLGGQESRPSMFM